LERSRHNPFASVNLRKRRFCPVFASCPKSDMKSDTIRHADTWEEGQKSNDAVEAAIPVFPQPGTRLRYDNGRAGKSTPDAAKPAFLSK
jgi:hypothetical protein